MLLCVPVYVGGEPMEVPRRHFLDKETAWAVIDDFFVTDSPVPESGGKPGCDSKPVDWSGLGVRVPVLPHLLGNFKTEGPKLTRCL